MYRVSRKKRRPFQRLGTLIAISILAGMLAGGAVGFMSAKSSNSPLPPPRLPHQIIPVRASQVFDFIIGSDEESSPCCLSARLSRRLRSSDHRRGRARHENPRRSRASRHPRISVRESGEVSGSGLFARSRALSHAAGRGKRFGRQQSRAPSSASPGTKPSTRSRAGSARSAPSSAARPSFPTLTAEHSAL